MRQHGQVIKAIIAKKLIFTLPKEIFTGIFNPKTNQISYQFIRKDNYNGKISV